MLHLQPPMPPITGHRLPLELIHKGNIPYIFGAKRNSKGKKLNFLHIT